MSFLSHADWDFSPKNLQETKTLKMNGLAYIFYYMGPSPSYVNSAYIFLVQLSTPQLIYLLILLQITFHTPLPTPAGF